MMLPATYATALLLTILTMLCWGSWANTVKLAGKWRFELFYFDYSIGVLLAAVVAAFTFGSFEGASADIATPVFGFLDNLTITTKTRMAYAIAGGAVFNLANLLLVAAISVAGLSVAFPIGIGLALIIGVILNQIIKPAGYAGLLAGGSALVLIAIVMTALAQAAHAATSARKQKQPGPVPGARGLSRPGPRPASPVVKGISLSLASGVLMGLFYPLVEMSKKGDLGLGPYAAAFMFAIGIVLTTPVYNLFFMNLPVAGEPISFGAYLRGSLNQHLLGLAGGIIWMAGAISNFVAASAPPSVHVGPAVSYAIGQGAALVSTLWGLLVWKEFAGASAGVKARIVLMLVFFIGGLWLLSLAPLYS
jgi:glucose uptake protein